MSLGQLRQRIAFRADVTEVEGDVVAMGQAVNAVVAGVHGGDSATPGRPATGDGFARARAHTVIAISRKMRER